jgi:hypothetical protein
MSAIVLVPLRNLKVLHSVDRQEQTWNVAASSSSHDSELLGLGRETGSSDFRQGFCSLDITMLPPVVTVPRWPHCL